ncbi:MAG: tRNA (N(6)-L-threonylcarbamoyladenosine(37)-C(2))-methylthiotransferase MtaB [Candidatus Goldiibacteriota bacterium HGW-Goldbacteria-1]|nr:MAG: tRNA (N(6)-L-threonylcarbamoyladenosine(37)-C(2))-methylthiotransferase MtaB [Candidatus Goldiibacteriota bacterium HGW-Goldbacteria-1]
MKIGFITYGCKVNQYDTERIKKELLAAGNEESPDPDVYIVNTCTVTDKIDRDTARQLRKLKAAGKKILLTGCIAARQCPEEIAASVDWFVPNSSKYDMALYPEELKTAGAKAPSFFIETFSEKNKAFVKVEDGCDRFCAYCEIPYVRGGKPVSRDEGQIINEIKALSKSGYREIILTGINLGRYGADKNEAGALCGLLEKIRSLKLPLRIRLSSIGPLELGDDIIKFAAASGNFLCRHFHMSMQSGCDRILKAMNRRYDTAFYRGQVDKILTAMPDAGITTDIIAGFPGETDADHAETAAFLKSMPFTRVHVFPYSDRPDTQAFKMPGKVSDEIKKKRAKELSLIAAQKEAAFAESYIGKVLELLVESGDKGGFYFGYTDNYIRVKVEGAKEYVNEIVKVKIISAQNGIACGEIIGK